MNILLMGVQAFLLTTFYYICTNPNETTVELSIQISVMLNFISYLTSYLHGLGPRNLFCNMADRAIIPIYTAAGPLSPCCQLHRLCHVEGYGGKTPKTFFRLCHTRGAPAPQNVRLSLSHSWYACFDKMADCAFTGLPTQIFSKKFFRGFYPPILGGCLFAPPFFEFWARGIALKLPKVDPLLLPPLHILVSWNTVAPLRKAGVRGNQFEKHCTVTLHSYQLSNYNSL